MQLGVLAGAEVRVQQSDTHLCLLWTDSKQPRESADRIKKTWPVDTIEYYLEKSEVLSFAGKQIKS